MPDISLYFQWFTNGQGTYFYSNGPSILAFDLEKIQLIIMEHATLTVGEGFPPLKTTHLGRPQPGYTFAKSTSQQENQPITSYQLNRLRQFFMEAVTHHEGSYPPPNILEYHARQLDETAIANGWA